MASVTDKGSSDGVICRDFLRQICCRGTKCKFKHVVDEKCGGDAAAAASAAAAAAVATGGANTESDSDDAKVCRDFLRNVCSRGARCKFLHPEQKPQERTRGDQQKDILQDTIVFCYDFQSLSCHRPHCRFLHCTREEEQEYKRSGYLPPHAKDEAVRKGVAPDLPAHFGARPICKDYLKGECHRVNRCRFRHVSAKQYDLEMNRSIGELFESRQHYQQMQQQQLHHQQGSIDGYYEFDCPPMHPYPSWDMMSHGSGGEPLMKRLRPDPWQNQGPGMAARQQGNGRVIDGGATSAGSNSASGGNGGGRGGGGESDDAYTMLQQENCLLKERVKELKKQVQDLTTANEFLLDRNAQLRLGVKATTAAAVVNAMPVSTAHHHPHAHAPGVVSMQPPTISIAAAPVCSLPAATITMAVEGGAAAAAAAGAPPPPTAAPVVAAPAAPPPPPISLPVQEPLPQLQEPQQAAQPPRPTAAPAAAGTVQLQETRLVSYPITSIGQQAI